jgi:hypothetical protein
MYMSDEILAEFNINQHIAQGMDFKNFRKRFSTSADNNHNLLENTSSVNLGSISEAFTSDESTRKKESFNIDADYNPANAQVFESMLSDYATEQTIHNSAVLQNQQDNDNSYQSRMQEKEKLFTSNKEGFRAVDHTLAGKIEASDLRMTSMYYHYLVYFIIAATLLSFTFNIMINPEANVMNAIVVVGGILLVYFFTRNVL